MSPIKEPVSSNSDPRRELTEAIESGRFSKNKELRHKYMKAFVKGRGESSPPKSIPLGAILHFIKLDSNDPESWPVIDEVANVFPLKIETKEGLRDSFYIALPLQFDKLRFLIDSEITEKNKSAVIDRVKEMLKTLDDIMEQLSEMREEDLIIAMEYLKRWKEMGEINRTLKEKFENIDFHLDQY